MRVFGLSGVVNIPSDHISVWNIPRSICMYG